MNESRKATALNLCIAIDSLWRRKASSRGSPETTDMRLPRALRNVKPLPLIGPSVSKANGTKSCVVVSCEYLIIFIDAALSAAEPAETEEREMYEVAKVSQTVTSHARGLPEDHGIWVAPSGRLPSARNKPGGSLTEGIPALDRQRKISSLRTACLELRAPPLLQDSMWDPRASTLLPQLHWCDEQMVAPRCRLMAIRTASSSRQTALS